MRRQIQQKVFPHERRKIDRLRPAQFGVDRERRNFHVLDKFFETADASELDRLRERAVGPKRTFRHADVDFVLHRTGATNSVRFQIADQTIFLPLQMQSLGWNLFEMNFHFLNFFPSKLATVAGTNFETSPPSRAISFTSRELK